MIQQINLNSSENVTLKLRWGFHLLIPPCEGNKSMKKKRRNLKHFLRVVGRPGYAIWLLVFEGEFPVIDSLYSGNVDDIVEHNLD